MGMYARRMELPMDLTPDQPPTPAVPLDGLWYVAFGGGEYGPETGFIVDALDKWSAETAGKAAYDLANGHTSWVAANLSCPLRDALTCAIGNSRYADSRIGRIGLQDRRTHETRLETLEDKARQGNEADMVAVRAEMEELRQTVARLNGRLAQLWRQVDEDGL